MAGVYSVAQVNSDIKNMFAQDFLLRRLSVKGEVSNCKYHSSGHIYFTLKDSGGTLQAVMFASQRRGLNFKLAEGQQVVVKGTVDVYERDGKYQLYASEIELSGRGDLYLRFEKLLKELEEMGMFDPQYKRPIPRFAKTVGIVTARGRARSSSAWSRRWRPPPPSRRSPWSRGWQQPAGPPPQARSSRRSTPSPSPWRSPGCHRRPPGCPDRRARRRFDRRPLGLQRGGSRQSDLRMQYAGDLRSRSRDRCDDRGLRGRSSGTDSVCGGRACCI